MQKKLHSLAYLVADCDVKETELVDVGFNFIFLIEYFISKAAAVAEIVADLLLKWLA